MARPKVQGQKPFLIFLAIVLMCSAVGLVACGGDDNDESTIPAKTVDKTMSPIATSPQTTVAATTPAQPTSPAISAIATTVTATKFSMDSKLGDVLADPQAKAVLDKYAGDLLKDYSSMLGMFSDKTLTELLDTIKAFGLTIDEGKLAAMAAELEAIK